MAARLSSLLRGSLAGSGLFRALPFARAYRGVILMCHRVVSDEVQLRDHPLTGGLWVSTAKLEASFDYFSRQGYCLLSLAEAIERIEKSDSRGSPFIVYTFDDGFVEIAELVQPLFHRAGVPFTAFIPSGIFTSNWVSWPYMLEALLLREGLPPRTAEAFGIAPEVRRSLAAQFEACSALFIDADSLACASRLMNALNVSCLRSSPEVKCLLSHDQVRRLASDSVATVAGHTRNHLALGRLPPESAITEVIVGNQELADVSGQGVEFFSYPYGSLPRGCDDSVQALKLMQIRAAVTTKYACVTSAHTGQTAFLPRFNLSEDVPLDHLDVRFNRIMDAIKRVVGR